MCMYTTPLRNQHRKGHISVICFVKILIDASAPFYRRLKSLKPSRVRVKMLGGVIQWLKRRKVVVLCLVFSFIVSGLIVNVMELATLPLYFVSKKWFRIINAKIVYLHWCVVPWALQSWANFEIDIYSNDKDVNRYLNTEHALVLLNHPGDLDWMIGWVMIDRGGMLGGTKAIMKDVAKFLPGIGWTFLFMEYPFLKRDWAHDEAALIESCNNLKDYPVYMLLCLFAEGTRFTKEKHKLSVEFAKTRGYPVLKHHLFPRTKGFCLLMKHLRDTVPAVYDITICFREDDPTLMDVINAKPSVADVFVRRFPTADIPESEEELSDWLINLYHEKDKLVDHYVKHKKFPEPVQKVNLRRSYVPDLIVFVWISLLGIPAFFTALYLAWVGAWITLGVIVAAIFVADQLFQYIANETNTKKSSSDYGLAPVSSFSHKSRTAPPTSTTTPPSSEQFDTKKDQ